MTLDDLLADNNRLKQENMCCKITEEGLRQQNSQLRTSLETMVSLLSRKPKSQMETQLHTEAKKVLNNSK